MTHDQEAGTGTEAAGGRVPHLELLRFYETKVLKVARRGLSAKDYALAIVVLVAGGAVCYAARTNPLAYMLAFVPLALSPLALLRRTLNDRGIAFGRHLRSGSDLQHAIVAAQLTELEGFLSKHGWLSESQLSHLCEIYQSQRAEHREWREWVGRWMMTCVGFVLSAIVGAAVASSLSRGEDVFARAVAQVGLLLVLVTGIVVIVGSFLQGADRRSLRLGGLVERLRAIQVRTSQC